LYLGAGAYHVARALSCSNYRVAPPLLYSSVEVRERSLSFLQVKSLQLGIRVTLHDTYEVSRCLFRSHLELRHSLWEESNHSGISTVSLSELLPSPECLVLLDTRARGVEISFFF
jgi:hypothetical protein